MKAIYIDSVPLRPLPKELLSKVGCVHCRTRSARWELAQGGDAAWSYCCSLCFLYALPTLRDQEEVLRSLIDNIEKARGVSFLKDSAGRLIESEDGDRVVTGIIVADRYMHARQRAQRAHP